MSEWMVYLCLLATYSVGVMLAYLRYQLEQADE